MRFDLKPKQLFIASLFFLFIGCSQPVKKETQPVKLESQTVGKAVQAFVTIGREEPILERRIALMKQSNLSKCPEDFRRAWWKFIWSFEAIEQVKVRGKDLENLLHIFQGAKLGTVGMFGALLTIDRSDSNELKQAKEAFNSASDNLERVATAYLHQ